MLKQGKGREVADRLWLHLPPGSGSRVWCCCSALDSESASSSIRFSKACLKNVFSVLLILIYLLLMAVAVFLVYQTITDFREKLKHPVMSVSYKEVDRYDAPGRDPAPDGQRGPGLGRRLIEEPPMPSPTVLDSRGIARSRTRARSGCRGRAQGAAVSTQQSVSCAERRGARGRVRSLRSGVGKEGFARSRI